jgi:hypothetical protein
MNLADLFESTQLSVGEWLERPGISDKSSSDWVKFKKTGVWEDDLYADDVGLSSLEGSPTRITGKFGVSGNNLTSITGGPKFVAKEYDLSDNKITSIEGLDCEVGETIDLSNNPIESLKDIHKKLKLTDPFGGELRLYGNKIRSHVLGLLLVQGLHFIQGYNKDRSPWILILTDAIKKFDDPRKRVMWAQAELIKELGEQGKALAQL